MIEEMKEASFFLTFICLAVAVFGQHEQHMQMKDTVKGNMHMKDSASMGGHDMMKQSHMMHGSMDMDDMMSHSFSRNLPMSRNGSGTGWSPDASPMYGNMYRSRNWMYMLHYNLFLRYTDQDFSNKGTRGNHAFDAPNWLMFMGQRRIGENGLVHFGTMFSLDPLTEGEDGYPLLFQSGESYKGKPLVDRQHPHDLFSELSVSYTEALSKKTDVFLYLAYPGEPALGPVAFMHRPSALYNPDAPLSHHWVDATHITFGVATIGIRVGDVKLEGSSFTGREPNENRYNFDKPRFDSWSGRISYNPSKNWALQLSHGFIKSPEELHPSEDVNRTTASVTYAKPIMGNGWFNAIALWGVNKVKDQDAENAFLLELSWRKSKLAVHGRYEFVQKSVEELSLSEQVYGKETVFPVNAYTVGLNYDLFSVGKANVSIGGQYTINHTSARLGTLYGSSPMAYEFFLRLYPRLMKMN